MELEAYVKKNFADNDVVVEKSQLRRTDSSAFVVTTNRRNYYTLMIEDSWEKNARVRPYRAPRNDSTR